MVAFALAPFTDPERNHLNKCRIFLQAVTLANISTGDGTLITQSAWKGIEDDLAAPRYQWMKQGPLTTSDWNLWQQALSKCFCTRGLNLKHPLGKWTSHTLGAHQWYYDPTSERLLEQHGDSVRFFSRQSGRPSRKAKLKYHSATHLTTSEIPPSACPAKVFKQGSLLALSGWAPAIKPPTHQATSSFSEYVKKNVHPDAAWAVTRFIASNADDGKAVAESIKNGCCVAISDGSFKDEFGTASWIVQGEDEFGSLEGSLVTPGNPEDQSAYRSELAGLYGIAAIVNLLCQYHKITEGSITIGCDGLQALLHGTSTVDFIPTKMAQFDLVGATRTMLQRSPVKWIAEHVLGHQDDDTSANLDRKAMLNVLMDGEAKFHWSRTSPFAHQVPRQQKVEGEPWSLWIGDTKICANIYDSVVNTTAGKAAEKYWEVNKQRFGSCSAKDVDWDATEKAMKAQPRARQQWITKHTTGFCAVGKMMLRRKEWPNSECPRCKAPEETTAHIWKCPHPEATALWEKSLKKFMLWMLTQQTPLALAKIICDRLSAWRSDTEPTLKAPSLPVWGAALELQDKMGWQSFFEGTPAVGWFKFMDRHYNSRRSNKNGRRWLSAIIKKLWNIAWDLWEHRNGIVHDKQAGMTAAKLQQEVRNEFQKGSANLPQEVRNLMRSSKEVLAWPSHYQRSWLIRIQKARARDECRRAEENERYTSERQGMYAWLGL